MNKKKLPKHAFLEYDRKKILCEVKGIHIHFDYDNEGKLRPRRTFTVEEVIRDT